jgi:peptidoglycan/LPS O-acetylase OafA/YrhL
MKRLYPGLDLVRFAAALIVTLFHLAYFDWHGATSDFAMELSGVGSTFSFGWVGVPIFFVLSGFVIAFSAAGRTAEQFIKSRVVRLYPSAWICATITAIFIFGDPSLIEEYLRSVMLIPVGPWVDVVYWTLGVEIAFYSLVALVLMVAGGRRLTQVGLTLGAIGSVFWLLRLADYSTGRHLQPVFALFETSLGGLFLLTSGCFFALGVILYSVQQDGLSKSKVGVLALCILGGLISIIAGARYRFITGEGPQINIVVAPAVWMIAVCTIAASVFLNDTLLRFAVNWQSPIRIVGLATYPLYLLHHNIGLAIMKIAQPVGALTALAFALVCVISGSFLIVYLERFPRRLLLAGLSLLSSTNDSNKSHRASVEQLSKE